MKLATRVRLRMLTVSGFFLLLSVGLVWAATEPADGVLIPYSGQLQQDGVPVDGTASVTFELFAAESGGAAFYSETDPVLFVGGNFSHVIGEQNGLDTDDIDGRELWLAITVEGTPLGGRQHVTPAPRAVTSGRAHNLTLTTNRTVPTGWNESLVLGSAGNAAITHGDMMFGMHETNNAFYWRGGGVDPADFAMTLSAGAVSELTVDSLAGAWDDADNGCVRLGGMQIAWGAFGAVAHTASSANVYFGFGSPVTFPCEFRTSTVPSITITPDYDNDGVFNIIPGRGTATNTGFTPLAWASSAATTGATNRYLAIGVW